MRAFPVSRYFGSCGVFALAYGMGYAVSATIGAIPVGDVWPFCAEVFGVDSFWFNPGIFQFNELEELFYIPHIGFN